jgi:hypothetical protein
VVDERSRNMLWWWWWWWMIEKWVLRIGKTEFETNGGAIFVVR